MNKILGVSLVAVLVVSPMMAKADYVAGNPASYEGDAPGTVTASATPVFDLASADSTKDAKLATGKYVKGAYNAAIKAINKVSSLKADLDLANISATGKANIAAKGTFDTATTYESGTVGYALKNIATSGATQDGVEATIKNTEISVDASGLALSSGAVTGSVTIDALDEWGTDSLVSGGIAATTSLSVDTTIAGTNGVTASIVDTSVSYSTTVNQ